MIKEITQNLKCIAVLEAIICPEWEYRCFSYNSHWGDEEEMASMNNSSGDEWFLWVKGRHAAVKLINYEIGILSDISSIRNEFPPSYAEFISESAFSIDDSSSLWYLMDNDWVKFDVDREEARSMLAVFDWSALDYKEWADDYYENDIPIEAIENIMAGSLTEGDVQLLNPDLRLKDLDEEIEEIGYRIV